MTDAARRGSREMNERERMARRICNELVFLGGSERESFVLKALADAERRGLERAAGMAEEKAERSLKGEHLNIPEYNFGYRSGLRGLADEIREKLLGIAQAGEVG